MPAHRNLGNGDHDELDTPAELRPVGSDSWRKAKKSALNWLGGVAGLLVVGFVGGGYGLVSDMQQRIVRLETQMVDVQKSLDRIENNTNPHDGRVAAAGHK